MRMSDRVMEIEPLPERKAWVPWIVLYLAVIALVGAGLLTLGTRGLVLGAVATAFLLVAVAVLRSQPTGLVALIGALFALLLLLPVRLQILVTISFLGYTYSGTYLLLFALLLALGLLLYLQTLSPKRPLASKLDLLFIGLVAISLISFWLNSGKAGYDTGDYVRASILLFGPMLIFLLLMRLNLRTRELELLISLLILLAFVVALLGVLVSTLALRYLDLLGWETAWGVISADLMRARTPVGSAGSTAIFVGIVLPLVVTRLIFAPGWAQKLVYATVLLTGLACMLLAQSRTPLLSLALAGLVFLPILRTKRGASWFLVLVTVILVGTVLLAARFDLSGLTSRRVSDSLRFESLETAFEIFSDHPLAGTGMGRIYPRDESGEPTDTLYYKGGETLRDPHNQYAMSLAETGILGFALLLVFLSTIGYAMIINLKGIKDGKRQFLARAFAASVLTYIIYSLLSSSMSATPKVAIAFWFVAGLGWCYIRASLGGVGDEIGPGPGANVGQGAHDGLDHAARL